MMGSCGRQVLVAEAWCPVSGKARVQAALREVALATSATVRPRPPMCLAAMPTCAARRDPPYSRVLGVYGCPMQPAPTAAPRKRRHAARWCRAPRGGRARAGGHRVPAAGDVRAAADVLCHQQDHRLLPGRAWPGPRSRMPAVHAAPVHAAGCGQAPCSVHTCVASLHSAGMRVVSMHEG